MTTLELADIQVDDLESLRRALEADTHGDGEVRWTTVKLANLYIRDNSAEINPESMWVCVQVGALMINNQTYVLSPHSLDAHITLGYWIPNPSEEEPGKLQKKQTNFLLGKLQKKYLAENEIMEMEVTQGKKSKPNLLLLEFMVHSRGGGKLHSLRQSLQTQADKLKLLSDEWGNRTLSGRGLVFHLSIHARAIARGNYVRT